AYDDDNADESLKLSAIEALGKLGDPRAIPVCTRALVHEDQKIRREAAMALWRLGDKGNAPMLVRALRDPYAEDRAMTIWALEKAVDPNTVIPELVKIMGDGSTMVRSYV